MNARAPIRYGPPILSPSPPPRPLCVRAIRGRMGSRCGASWAAPVPAVRPGSAQGNERVGLRMGRRTLLPLLSALTILVMLPAVAAASGAEKEDLDVSLSASPSMLVGGSDVSFTATV